MQVAVYDDRVEVTSLGMVFGSLKIEDINVVPYLTQSCQDRQSSRMGSWLGR
ncbi:hypothetical protein DXA13_03275 [Clostridium sp. AM58-1XD]|nr:hypothetical protein DXA13_03275 [Clostridium sp. AM58-1XD]